MFVIEAPTRRRRPDLTPMIDVVFLLLVFFMLSSQFSRDVSIPLLTGGGAGAAWEGPLRLVDVGEGGAVKLNGSTLPSGDLAPQLRMLMAGDEDPVALRGRGASTQDLVDVMDHLRAAGVTRLVVVE
jgi:biopolymer transport protein ExbD